MPDFRREEKHLLNFLLFSGFLFVVPAFGQGTPAEISRPAFSFSAVPDSGSTVRMAIPKDLDAARDELDRILPGDLKNEIRGRGKNDLVRYHMSLGMWVRNNWGLWEGSALSRWFQDQGVISPDDMSGVVISAFWHRQNGLPSEIEPLLEEFGIRSIAAVSLPVVEIGAGKKKETLYRLSGWGFTADLSPLQTVRVSEREKGRENGFVLSYFFGGGKKQILAVYSGGHPGFPQGVPGRTRIRKGNFAGFPAEFSEWKHKGLFSREIKVELQGDSPSWLHLWYHGLNATEKKEAEKLLGRFHPGNGTRL